MNSQQQLEAEIEAQRAQLAATIDELHDRLEVKARSTARVAAVVAGVALVGVIGLAVWRRTHHS